MTITMTTNGNEMRPLPPDWDQVALPDLISPRGVFSDGDWVESKDQNPEGDVRLIQLADIGDGYYRDRSNRFLTYQKAIELNCTFLEKGDVLIARMPDPLGRACIFPGDTKKSVTVVDVCIVRTGLGDLNHRWLMHWINSPVFRSEIEKHQSGTTRKRISRKNLAKIQFPVPPLPEQERIVAEIEKQFTRLDQAVASLRRLQGGLARYKASVLKAACNGRLVPQDPNDEPAANLLARILAERRAQWQAATPGKKYKEPAGVDTAVLPAGWSHVVLGDVLVFIGSGITPKGGKSVYRNQGIKFLRSQNIHPGELRLDDVAFVSQELHDKMSRTHIQDGDILLNITGASIGRSVYVPEGFGPANVNQHVCILRLPEFILPTYLSWYLNSSSGQTWIMETQSGATRQGLNYGQIREMVFPLPPFAEQQRIVAEVERRLSVVAAAERAIAASLARAGRLRQAILHQAFSGRLVAPFTPTPASLTLAANEEK
jgi:type I restriction enzyme, S subunit